MYKTLIPLVCLVLVLGGCAANKSLVMDRTAGNSMSATRLDLDVTILPALDARAWPAIEKYPDLDEGVTVFIPAFQVLEWGSQTLKDQGVFKTIKPYGGPFPDQQAFRWSEFPMRGLGTDLGLGVELRRLDLKRARKNVFLVPHALADSLLLPFFGAASFFSRGHFDLAGWVTPSNVVEHTVEIKINFISLRAGGLVFSKGYVVSAKNPAVADRELHHGFLPSREDGQELGEASAPLLVKQAFEMMGRDQDLAMLPLVTELAWLERAMARYELKPPVKAGLLARLAALTDRLREAGVWRENERLLAQVARMPLGVLAGLEEVAMRRPLTREEKELEEAARGALAGAAHDRRGYAYLKSVLSSGEAGPNLAKAVAAFMADALEFFDNEEFIEGYARKLAQAAGQGDEKAAGVLVRLYGPAAVSRWGLGLDMALGQAGARDAWAEGALGEAMASGETGADHYRLMGALNFAPGLDYLLKQLDDVAAAPPGDRPAIIRALSAYREAEKASQRLNLILARALDGELVKGAASEEIAALASGLGQMGSPEANPLIFEAWLRPWPGFDQPHLIRRACLAAMAALDDEELKGMTLAAAERMAASPRENQAALRETVDFWARIRYAPALGFMYGLAADPGTPEALAEACLAAMGGYASAKAKALLEQAAEGPSLNLARAAQAGLERRALTGSLLAGLEEADHE